MPKSFDLLTRLFLPKAKKETPDFYDRIAAYGFGPKAMQRIKVCECCGAQSGSEEVFCASCGAELPKRTLYDLYCTGHGKCECCGAVMPEDADYCPICGTASRRLRTEAAKKKTSDISA